MPWLFERLVGQLLGEAAGPIAVREQQTRLLDALGRLTIRHDLLFVDGRIVVAVADTKNKLLDDQGQLPNADAYQLDAYCARLGLDTGHLIYAGGDDPRPDPYEILGSDIRLVVHSVDLDQPIPVLEHRVWQLHA